MHPQFTPSPIPTFRNGLPHYVVDEAGCWLWQGSVDVDGYGYVCFGGRMQQHTHRAHRWYYTLHVGPIPDGFYIHHRCHVRWCVNPDHLEAVSPRAHGAYWVRYPQGWTAPAAPPRPVLGDDEQRALVARRFWKRVQKTDGCWLWAGQPSQKRGLFSINRRCYSAHRISYEMAYGPIPDGLWVLHRCDNMKCVRPEHLWLGTHRDNMADMARKGRAASGPRNSHALYPERTPRGEQHYRRVDPARGARGERIASHKLTPEQVREIRRLYAAGGTSQPRLARQFGLDQASIWAILHRKTWAHVPD